MRGLALRLPSAYSTLCCRGIWVCPEIMVLPSGTLSRTLELEKFHHRTSTVAGVVSLVWPTTITSLSHWASTFVYNKMCMWQRVARVLLQQLTLVCLLQAIIKTSELCPTDTDAAVIGLLHCAQHVCIFVHLNPFSAWLVIVSYWIIGSSYTDHDRVE